MRAVLVDESRRAYTIIDREMRVLARDILRIVDETDRDAVMAAIRLRITGRWWVAMARVILDHIERVRRETYRRVAHRPVRSRGELVGLRLLTVRVIRQERWIVERVETMISEADDVMVAVKRFLDPASAHVQFLATGAIVRRSLSSGPYAGTYARALARQLTSEAYGGAMREIAIADGDALRWTLAAGHVEADACDGYAWSDPYGLGPGVYPAAHFPEFPEHRGCLCSIELVRR